MDPNKKQETPKLNKKELVEKTIKFYMDLESWDDGSGDFKDSLREMAVKILSYEPTRLSQLFPSYQYVHPWAVSGPTPEWIAYIQSILDDAKELAIRELSFTQNEANA